MNKTEFLQAISGGLIVSCQALPGEPFLYRRRRRDPLFCGGSSRSRCGRNSCQLCTRHPANQRKVSLPIIGIIKRDYLPEEPFITATMREVDELVATGVEVIALDCTSLRKGTMV